MKLLCRVFGHKRFELPIVRLPSLDPIGKTVWCRRCLETLK